MDATGATGALFNDANTQNSEITEEGLGVFSSQVSGEADEMEYDSESDTTSVGEII